MSLYYETAPHLNSTSASGSLKFKVFSAGPTKSRPLQIFALASEASKWSSVLAEVIEHAQLLQSTRKLTPNLALLLVHDLLLTKRGISTPATHPLRLAVEKHKARLTAELTRARLRRGFASLEQLQAHINDRGAQSESALRQPQGGTACDPEDAPKNWAQPRWVRVNTLKTTFEGQMKTTFSEYKIATTLDELLRESKSSGASKMAYIDNHIPNLLALPPATDVSKTRAYLDGLIILQDKASCFPAYLLDPDVGEVCIDACAAPGNKTTHLAAILHEKSRETSGSGPIIHASERDPKRASTLEIMVGKAGASNCVRLHRQDFLKFDPSRPPYSYVSAILLDPSCSGSGIVSRDQTFNVTLPSMHDRSSADARPKKKRKRIKPDSEGNIAVPKRQEEISVREVEHGDKVQARLTALSEFQLRLLLHAFRSPNARKITYSTCSIYAEENENVVIRALLQSRTEELGWRILLRSDQIAGMQAWHVRGNIGVCQDLLSESSLDPRDIAEACIRCKKGTNDGTQGFFVAAFVRDPDINSSPVEEDLD